MLKSFMQPTPPSHSGTESTRTGHSGYPNKLAESAKAAEATKAVAAPATTQYAHNEEGKAN